MSRRPLVAILVALVTTAGCTQNRDADKRRLFDVAQKYAQQKKYAEAAIEYRKALQIDPKYGEAREGLGDALIQTSDYVNALREYMRAADVLTDDMPLQLKTGNMLLLAGLFDDAKVKAQKVLAREPRNTDALVLLGNARAGLKDLTGAVTDIQNAIKLDPTHSAGYASLGTLQFARGREPAAEEAFKRAITANPSQTIPRLALANYYWRTSKLSQAEEQLKSAVALSPNDIQVNRTLAFFYVSTDRSAAAEPYLKTIADVAGNTEAKLALSDFYASNGREAEATSILNSVTAPDASYRPAQMRLAALEFKSGRASAAHERLNRVLTADPHNVAALTLGAQFMLTEGKVDEAIAQLRSAIAQDSRHVPAYQTLGRALQANQDVEGALEAYGEAVKLFPNDMGSLLELARIQLAIGHADTAVGYADQVMKVKDDDLDARLVLGRALMTERQVDRATQVIAKGLSQYSDSAQLHSQAGTLALLQTRDDEARREFDRSLALDSSLVEPLVALTAMDIRDKKLASARARLEPRLNGKPDNAAVLILASRVYGALGDFVRTEAVLKRAIAADPAAFDGYAMLGQLYAGQRRIDDARREFQRWTERDPRSVPALTMLALLNEAQGEFDTAQKRYEQILEIDPDAAVASNNLAWLYTTRGGSLDSALQLATTAVRRAPDSPTASDTLGWIYYKKGMHTLAIGPLARAFERRPDNGEYAYHLGAAYAERGDTERARELLERAVSAGPSTYGDEARQALASLSTK